MQTYNDIHDQQNAIKLSDNISYKFDLDYAQLGAELAVPDERFNSADRCQLQLWACDVPYQGDQLRGVKIAESAYIHAGHGPAIFDNVPIMPPAGDHNFAMVMALVSTDQDGRHIIEDYVNFSQRQQFVQPRLGVIVQTAFDADALNIVIDGIENPRDEHNLSGDLRLEIWATTAPYQGGSIDGIWLGGLNLGQLVGGALRPTDNYRIRLDQSKIHAGGHLVLMLREWTINGFVTRHFRDLQLPSLAAATTEQPPAAHATDKTPTATVIRAKKVVKTKTAIPVDKLNVAAKAKTGGGINNDALRQAPAKRATVAPPRKRKKRVDIEAASVSVNTASVDELHQVKGVSASVANNIIAQRPYEKLGDLLRVAGMGPKLLERIKSMLKV